MGVLHHYRGKESRHAAQSELFFLYSPNLAFSRNLPDHGKTLRLRMRETVFGEPRDVICGVEHNSPQRPRDRAIVLFMLQPLIEENNVQTISTQQTIPSLGKLSREKWNCAGS